MQSEIQTTLTESEVEGGLSAVWVARHGERIDFVDRAWTQSAERPFDPHLSEKGALQAQKLAQRLEGEGITHIFASPFLRTLQTAWPIAEGLNLSIKVEHGLGEWLNPQWFSAPPTYLTATDRPELFSRVDSAYSSIVQPDYPETWQEFEARMAQVINQLTGHYAGNILLVGHGAVLTGIAQSLVTGKPRINTPLCGLVLATHEDTGWTLALNGDTAHLRDSQNLHQGIWA